MAAISLVAGGVAGVATARDGLLPTAIIVTAISIAVATLRVPLIGLLSFVAIATLLPFAVVPLRVGVSPTLIDVTVSAVLGACLARGLHKKDHFHLTPPTLALGVFIWLAVIALVAGTAIARLGAEEARMFVKLVNGLLLFVAVAQIVRTESELCVVLRTLMMSGMVAAVIALLIHALPPDTIATVLSALEPLGYPSGLGVLRPIVNTEALRATGTSVDPNVLGGTLMLVAALLAGQLLAPAPIFPRWAVAVGALPVLLAITLTYSRSAWVGLGIAVLYLAMVKDRRTWLAIVFAAAGLVLVPPGRAMLARLLSGFGAQDPAAALRLSEYRDAVSLISQYPLLGVGFGDPPRIDLYIGVSNLYLQMAEHMGLIGLAAFLVVVAIVTVRAFPLRIPRDEVGWGVLASLQAATVAALVAGLFDHYFFGLRFPHMVSLFWLTLGLLSAFAGLIRYEHRAGGHSVEYADARR